MDNPRSSSAASLHFGHVLDQDGREVEVSRRPALCLYVLINEPCLLDADAEYLPELFRGHAMIVRPQREVHLTVRQGEIELVLTLREAVRIRCGYRLADAWRKAQVPGQCIHLRFVQ